MYPTSTTCRACFIQCFKPTRDYLDEPKVSYKMKRSATRIPLFTPPSQPCSPSRISWFHAYTENLNRPCRFTPDNLNLKARTTTIKMSSFKDWPLWAQVAVIVPAAISYIPLYFTFVLLKECREGRKIRRSKTYQNLGGDNIV